MKKVILEIPDEEHKRMLRTIKVLKLDSNQARLVYAMCTALFKVGANEATKYIKKQIEEKFKEKDRKLN